MDLNLKESVVLVTGSSSGIGKAAAIAFGAERAHVGVTYHANRQGAEDTAQKVREAGGQALILHYDWRIQIRSGQASRNWTRYGGH